VTCYPKGKLECEHLDGGIPGGAFQQQILFPCYVAVPLSTPLLWARLHQTANFCPLLSHSAGCPEMPEAFDKLEKIRRLWGSVVLSQEEEGYR
jgi:hypothetical protein